MANKVEKEHNVTEQGNFFSSMTVRIWLCFLMVACILLCAFYLLNTYLLGINYSLLRQATVEEVGQTFASEMSEMNYDEMLSEATSIASGYYGAVHIFSANCTYSSDGTVKISDYIGYIFQDVLDDDVAINDTEVSMEYLEQFFVLLGGKSEVSAALDGTSQVMYCSEVTVGSVRMSGASGTYYLLIVSTSTVSVLAQEATGQVFLIAMLVSLLVSMIFSYLVSRYMTKPIKKFSTGIRQMAKGDYTIEFEGNGMNEIDNLANDLNFVNEEISKTEQLRREFLANVTHDLRTPLTMVKAYAEMIRDLSGDVPQKRNEHSEIIIKEADRLSSLVNEINQLSKIQAGVDKFDFKKRNIAAIAREVVDRFKIYQERDGYDIKCDIDNPLYCTVDVSKMEQVFYNLISNAINYTGADKRVTVTVKKVDGMIKISVSDTGKGIAKKDLDQVWERYYRASQKKRQVIGSGLGLSIVKGILVEHNAKFGIESVVGKGSTFWFALQEYNSESTKNFKNERKVKKILFTEKLL